MTTKTTRRAVRALLTLALATSLGTMSPSNATHTVGNLIHNPGFETSVLPANVVRDVLLNQPVLPTNWIVEGATALFDHTPHNPHAGKYSAAISGSYSGPRKDCSVNCTDVPGGDVKDTVYGTYSVAPSWRTDVPFEVSGGKRYEFSSYMRLSIPKDATGAVTMVRWFDANRVPIGVSAGPKLIAGIGGSNYRTFVEGATTPGAYVDRSTDWTYRTANVDAPGDARFAVVVLSYSDDAWIGQVLFDNVCFALATSGIC